MIRTLRLAAALLGLAAAPVSALAGNVDDIRVALPEIVELAELQPGLQVLTRLDIEVFATGGAYWVKHDGRWYSSRRPVDGFQAAEPRAVPPVLTGLKKGAYLDYRAAEGQLITQRRLSAELPQPAEPAAARPATREPPLPPPPARAAPAPAAAPAPRAAPPPAKKAPAKPAPKPKAKAAG